MEEHRHFPSPTPHGLSSTLTGLRRALHLNSPAIDLKTHITTW
jgi:hypothetical protein